VYYLVRSERIVGALAFCREQGQFDRASLKGLDSVAALVALLAENKLYREKAYDIAGFVNLDGLTGIYNHRYFQENLANELLKAQRCLIKEEKIAHQIHSPINVVVLENVDQALNP